MTLDEVKNLIKEIENNDKVSDDFKDNIEWGQDFEYNGVKFEGIEGGRYNSEYIVIFKIGEQYFKCVGWYDSWSGHEVDYSELEEVKPKQKTITIYE